MTQFKDKSAKLKMSNQTETIPGGLLMYPILMAADILLYDADYVPTGIDQKQHIELARNIAIRMNNKYCDLFKVCEPLFPEVGAKIMDLLDPTIKMSKSNANENGTIFLLDEPEVAIKKIMGAKTDALNKIAYDIQNQPGISNLLTIYSGLKKSSIETIVKQYQDKNYGEFKKDLANVVSNFLTDFQKKYDIVIKNSDTLKNQLAKNATKCLKITNEKIQKIYKAIGLI
jgi:tryptophanyl-tRNA synthetase